MKTETNVDVTAKARAEIPWGKDTNKIYRIIYLLNHIAHKVSSVILFLMMLLTTADVAGRYFFNKPITGAFELTGLALALIVFFSLGMTQITKDHIEIDFLTNKFPAKAQEILNIVSSSIIFVLLCLTSWQLFEYTKRLMASGELTGDLSLQLYFFTIFAAIGAILFTLTFILDIVKSILKVVQA
ncbi:TRAP transporter small permease [Bacillus sp. Marseille-P3661]|uniref:TRAP transporter small permease n=1 Tax=Bacillus sp. Marseille-P3661 TaxID=1936234 RepID=UPI000C84E5C4|nr:TRAP transporter small permease [Bacillus sp. Marseille-P3661]